MTDAVGGAVAHAAGDGRRTRRLRVKLGFVMPGVAAASRRLNEHPQARDLYPEYLITTHGVIRASVPLMEAARDRAQAMAVADPGDEVAAGLASYLDTHIPEERGHDEWLLDDLEVLGYHPAFVVERTPPPTVAAVVGAQYYWILHHHPVAILGYIAVLEGYPPSRELVDALIERTGHPRKAFRTMLAHGVLDPRHRDDLDAAIEALPLTPEQEGTIGLSALSTATLLTQLLDEVVDRHGT